MDASEGMRTMVRGKQRNLNFEKAVGKYFGFLHEHGFECARSEPSLVRFESQRNYVNVYHGRQSFEIGLEVGSLATDVEDIYSMSEIIRLIEPAEADGYRNYAARSPDSVIEGVQRLAMLFRRYVDAGVLDNAGLFEQLRKNRETWSREYARKVHFAQARQRLDVVWHEKDFEKIVELLRPLRELLTPSELQKLEYAERHLPRD